MSRTEAQEAAIDREIEKFGEVYCLWHRMKPQGKALIIGSQMHHTARRQPGGDTEILIYPLCPACHTDHHNGKEPRTSQLLWAVYKLWDVDLTVLYPRFFGKVAVLW